MELPLIRVALFTRYAALGADKVAMAANSFTVGSFMQLMISMEITSCVVRESFPPSRSSLKIRAYNDNLNRL